MKIDLNQEEVEILVSAVTTAHTYTLDALSNSINDPFSLRHVEGNIAHRETLLKLIEKLGSEIDDSYRMCHIIEYAIREEHPDVAEMLRLSSS